MLFQQQQKKHVNAFYHRGFLCLMRRFSLQVTYKEKCWNRFEAMVIACVSVCVEAARCYHMSSFVETKALEHLTKSPVEFVEYPWQQFRRLRPSCSSLFWCSCTKKKSAADRHLIFTFNSVPAVLPLKASSPPLRIPDIVQWLNYKNKSVNCRNQLTMWLCASKLLCRELWNLETHMCCILLFISISSLFMLFSFSFFKILLLMTNIFYFDVFVDCKKHCSSCGFWFV